MHKKTSNGFFTILFIAISQYEYCARHPVQFLVYMARTDRASVDIYVQLFFLVIPSPWGGKEEKFAKAHLIHPIKSAERFLTLPPEELHTLSSHSGYGRE